MGTRISCLRIIRCELLRSYEPVITYMYAGLLWLLLLLALLCSSLGRLRPTPRIPECRLCYSSDHKSAVRDYTDFLCSSKLLQIEHVATFYVRLIWSMGCLTCKYSRRNTLRHIWTGPAREETCCETLREVCGAHGYLCFSEVSLYAVGVHQDDLLA